MKPRLPWASLSLLGVLLVLAPYAMRLPPSFDEVDPLARQRFPIVLFGLVAAVAAFCECVVLGIKHRRDVFAIATYLASFLACAVVGLRSYPYWANGIYLLHNGTLPERILDPKQLIPMTWIGDLWRLPVLLLYLGCCVAIPLLFVMAAVAAKRRRYLAASIIGLCTVTALIFMVGFSPDYGEWLMD